MFASLYSYFLPILKDRPVYSGFYVRIDVIKAGKGEILRFEATLKAKLLQPKAASALPVEFPLPLPASAECRSGWSKDWGWRPAWSRSQGCTDLAGGGEPILPAAMWLRGFVCLVF